MVIEIPRMRIVLVLLALVVHRSRRRRACASCRLSTRPTTPTGPRSGCSFPAAGPTVTREAALSALLRGKLEHDLLGGRARASR